MDVFLKIFPTNFYVYTDTFNRSGYRYYSTCAHKYLSFCISISLSVCLFVSSSISLPLFNAQFFLFLCFFLFIFFLLILEVGDKQLYRGGSRYLSVNIQPTKHIFILYRNTRNIVLLTWKRNINIGHLYTTDNFSILGGPR